MPAFSSGRHRVLYPTASLIREGYLGHVPDVFTVNPELGDDLQHILIEGRVCGELYKPFESELYPLLPSQCSTKGHKRL